MAMNGSTFDRVSKLFAERRLSRRQALAVGSAGLVAAVGRGATVAQEGTPVPPTDSPAVSDASAERDGKIQYLFVQSYTGGTITAADQPDRYSVTLEGGAGQTVYFANRPSRDVGAGPTDQFLEGLGFNPENPPNAALVMEVEPGDQDIAVVELFNPAIDADTNAVRYDVQVLQNWEQSLELGFRDVPTDLASLVPEFGAAHLLIDDCADQEITCLYPRIGARATLGKRGFCYSFPQCHPCRNYATECNQVFPDMCQGQCEALYSCGPTGDFCL